jgi:hypothetical protein
VKRLLAGVVCLFVGCVFAPDFGNGALRCSSSGTCPPQRHCGTDGKCYLAGFGPTSDGGTPAMSGGGGDGGDAPSGSPDLSMPPPPVALDMSAIVVMYDAGLGHGRDLARCAPAACPAGSNCGNYPDGCGIILDCTQPNNKCGTGMRTCGGGMQGYQCGKAVGMQQACVKLKTCPPGACGGYYPDGCSSYLICDPCP